jgi:hypothetical protein
MTALDPFTRATATYQAATRHPFKSGQAWEGYAPAARGRPSWYLAAAGAAIVGAARLAGVV